MAQPHTTPPNPFSGSASVSTEDDALAATLPGLWEHTSDGVLVVQEGRIKVCNPAAARLLGRPPDLLEGHRLAGLLPSGTLTATTNGAPHRPVRLRRGDDRDSWVTLHQHAVRWQDRPAVLVLLRDITRCQQLEAQLNQTGKLETLGALVAGVAHEINNPINLIMYNTPLLRKIWADAEPVLAGHSAGHPTATYGGLTHAFLAENLGQMLADIDMAAARVATIVSSLKRFARQSAAAPQAPMDLNRAVRNALRLGQATLRKSGVHLELALADDLPAMIGDATSVEQVILNIVLNAVQSITHDRGRVVIRSGLAAAERRLWVSVADNGRGVNPAIGDRLFDPFITDKQSQGGTGLGLSVSRNIVKAHGGSIDFTPRPEGGTEFTVRFPLPAADTVHKVLIVDDDVWIRDLLKNALSRDPGLRLDESTDGVEACIRLGAYRPDLLILDLFMPKMDGLAVCRAIRQDPGLADMRVVITTGFPDHPKLKQVAALGFDTIIYKPFEIQTLLDTVDGLLGRGSAVRRAPS